MFISSNSRSTKNLVVELKAAVEILKSVQKRPFKMYCFPHDENYFCVTGRRTEERGGTKQRKGKT